MTGALIFTGCATSTPPSPENTSTSTPSSPPQEAPSSIDTTADSSNNPTTPAATIPTTSDSDQPVPIEDLPTKKIKGIAYPYAVKTKWTGLVKSPYAQDKQLVDVSTISSGSAARCPYTGKIFIVP